MRLEPIERLNLVLAAVATAGAWIWVSREAAASVALGAGFAVLNFRALASAARRMFDGQLQGSGPWVVLFGLRFVLLAVAIGLALGAGAHAVGLVVGLSTTVPATLIGAWRMRPPILPDAPALSPDDPEWDRWDAWRARERDVSPEDPA